MIQHSLCLAAALLLGFMICLPSASAAPLTDKEQLGKLLFADKTLSSPNGLACQSCHEPAFGFADPDQNVPTSAGIMPNRFGNRNAPTNTYRAAAPDFGPDPLIPGGFRGGMFLDGRAKNLFEQAQGPFVNPLEMHQPNHKLVVQNVQKAQYASLFQKVYGKDIFKNQNYEQAYLDIADAITAFEKSPEMNKFNSKLDLFVAGQVQLTDQELRGFKLFTDPTKTPCAICHTFPNIDALGNLISNDKAPFTDERYFNIGVPKNPDNPFYTIIDPLNPDGENFVDFGLGGNLKKIGQPDTVYGPQLGAFKVPTLRNIAKTAPYMHNGAFKNLKEVVHFYNTRDVTGVVAEVDNGNVVGRDFLPFFGIGHLGLTDSEENDLVAFLGTLTDDYKP